MSDMELPIKYSETHWTVRREAREEYVRRQQNRCFYCNESLSENPPESVTRKLINWRLFPTNFLRSPIHLQHNHSTDLTEGAVHAYCNAVMWQYHGR